MRPTEVSSKKSSRNKNSNILRFGTSKQNNELSSRTPQAITARSFIVFFNNVKLRRDEILHKFRHNKTIKLLFFIFSPQIITLILMFKMYQVCFLFFMVIFR